MTFNTEFKQHISTHNLIGNGTHVLVAVSGGVDSMVLLHLLSGLRREKKLQLSAIHVQHHLRPDAEKDAHLVKSFCDENEIDFYRADLDPESKPKDQSVEAWARSNRYSHFFKLQQSIKANVILTGHHGDDQIETVLMHIVEGTGLDGLKGVREKMESVVRPLLPFSKTDIEAYAQKFNVPYRLDSTNTDLSHPRNYLRHKVIPKLKDQNPNLNSAIQDLSSNINDISDIIDYTMKLISKRVVEKQENGKILLNFNELSDVPLSLKAHLVKYVLNEEGMQWRKYHWERINQLISDGQTGSIIKLGNNEILKNRGTLIIQKIPTSVNSHFEVHQGEKIQTDDFTFTWQTTDQYSENSKQSIETVDGEKLPQSIELRKWKEGDYFQPLGMEGHKKVSDFLTDIKLDRFTKNSQYVLANHEEVFWVCGRRLSDSVKITPETTQFAELSFRQDVV